MSELVLLDFGFNSGLVKGFEGKSTGTVDEGKGRAAFPFSVRCFISSDILHGALASSFISLCCLSETAILLAGTQGTDIIFSRTGGERCAVDVEVVVNLVICASASDDGFTAQTGTLRTANGEEVWTNFNKGGGVDGRRTLASEKVENVLTGDFGGKGG